jgi:hypothetical protein
VARRRKFTFASGSGVRGSSQRKLSLYLFGRSIGWPPRGGSEKRGLPTVGISFVIGERAWYAGAWRRPP